MKIVFYLPENDPDSILLLNEGSVSKIAYFVADYPENKKNDRWGGKGIYGFDVLAQEDRAELTIVVGSNRYYVEMADTLKKFSYIENEHFFNGFRLTAAYYRRIQKCGWLKYEYETRPKMDESHWVTRSKIVAGVIPAHARVILDIGCGDMKLKQNIQKDQQYIGLDYKKRDKDTIVFNLNEQDLSEIDVGADTYVFAGVLEYVNDLERLISQMWRAKYIVFSYSPLDYNLLFSTGRFPIFSNHFMISEILACFIKNGFALEHIETFFVDNNIICRMRNKKYKGKGLGRLFNRK